MDFATGAISTLLPKLDLLVREFNLTKGEKNHVLSIHSKLKMMQDALQNISETPPEQFGIQGKMWARDVREASYDIEDCIDRFMLQCDQAKVFNMDIRRSLGLLTELKNRRNILTNIGDINRRVEEVSKRRDRYTVSVVANPATANVDPRLLRLHKKMSDLIGIDDARDELINILMERNEVSKKQRKIVSIVGISGLGKTTLANTLFENLIPQFECGAFVSVSKTPDIKKLFSDMLYELGNNINKETLDESESINKLKDFLHDKRYFIVLDDIWDISVWDLIRCALPDNDSGYRIITTTRIIDVAGQVGGAYKLKPLSLHSSRKLFYMTIFGNEDRDICSDEEMAEVFDRILKECAGIPLAIITLASLLATKGGNITDWYKVYDSVGTGLEKDVHVMDMRTVLSLGYYDLPSELKTCFLYLSVFPEDYNIEKNRLIWLWIAEGFIRHADPGDSLFELGERYYCELVNRNLIQPVHKKWNDMTEYCRVPSIMLDLIRSLSSEEMFVTIVDDVQHTSPSGKVRRLSFQNSMVDNVSHWATMSIQHIRSVSVFSSVDQKIAVSSFRILRVLNLQSSYISQGSLKYIEILLHLRYLGLRDTHIAQLPEEIGNLKFLQTLDITDNAISSLPSTVFQLKQLMCLRIGSWTRAPIGIGSLTYLEELSTLCISDNTDIIAELGHLTELRVLSIDWHIRWNDGLEKSLGECLHKLQKIHTLTISVFGECNLDAWVNPRHLRRLELTGCWSSMLSSWMNPSLLLDLSFLSIEIRKLQQADLDVLGRLPALKYLDLEVNHENLGILKRLVVGSCSFPFLADCVLRGSIGHLVFCQGAMQRLTSLCFTFAVREMREIADCDGCFHLGLGNLLSLQDVTVSFLSDGASERDVVEAEAVLRHATEMHPNHPSLEIY